MAVGFRDGNGQGEPERGACAEAAFDGDFSALRLDQAPHQSESETGGSAVGVAGKAAEDGTQALRFYAAAVVVDEELDAILLFGSADADVATFRREAEGVGEEIIDDGAKRTAIGLNVSDVFEGQQFNVDVLVVGLVAAANEGVAKSIDGTDFFDAELATAGFELGDLDKVEHQVVQVFGFVRGAGGEFHLEGAEFACVVLGKRIQGKAEATDRFTQLLRGDREEARFETIDLGDLGHILEQRDCSQEFAFAVAHGRGAEPVAAFGFADAHGEERGFSFAGGSSALHRDGCADAIEDFVSTGGTGEDHAIDFGALRGDPEDLGGSLVELEHLAFTVGHNDGFENGADDRVGELKIHLAASGFGFAKIAKADGEAIQFGGDGAEVIFGAPFNALMEIALPYATSYLRGMAQRGDDQKEHDRGDDGRRSDGESAGGDEAAAESILLTPERRDAGIAERGEPIEVAAQFDMQGFDGTRELGRFSGRMLDQARVLLSEMIDGEGSIETANVLDGNPE